MGNKQPKPGGGGKKGKKGKKGDSSAENGKADGAADNKPNGASSEIDPSWNDQVLYAPDGTKKITTDDFELLTVVGKGSFGKVMQVRKKDNGRIYAMKVSYQYWSLPFFVVVSFHWTTYIEALPHTLRIIKLFISAHIYS